jgi:hypothetical protein
MGCKGKVVLFADLSEARTLFLFGEIGKGGGLSAIYRVAALATLQAVCLLFFIATNSMYE